MTYIRWGLFVAIFALCAYALTICAYLMGLHSPLKGAGFAPAFSNLWADACAGEGEQQGGGCEKIIKSPHGSITIPWRTEIITETRDAEGKVTKQAEKKWVPFNVPVALVGQSYYIFLLVWFLFTGLPRREGRWWHLLPVIMALGAAAISTYYIYIMASVVQDWCKLCLRLHIIDYLLLAAVLVLWPFARRVGRGFEVQPVEPGTVPAGPYAIPASLRPLRLRHALATLACAAVLIAALFSRHHDQQKLADTMARTEAIQQGLAREQERIDFVLGAYLGTPPVTIPRRSTEITFGPATAPHEMIIFSDLQCPACYTFESTLRDQILLNLWKGTMKYTFRHYPLCNECNPFVKNMHPQGCQAAFALEAARIVGGIEGFDKMHNHLLKKYKEIEQAGSNPVNYEKYASEIGLDAAAFSAAFQGEEVRKVIEEDIRVARQVGATSTPTVFIDGRRLNSYPMQTNNPHFWQALAKLHAASPPTTPPAGQ